jgi:hypothetical protein
MYYKVFWSYLKAFIWAIVLISIIYITVMLLNGQIYFSEKALKIMQIFGIVFEATALYGKLGWGCQTWSGNSWPEYWDNVLFYFFSSVGIILTIIPLII